MNIEVDFFKKRTDSEKSEAWDKFWLAFTPKWFEWLGWVLIIGAFKVLRQIADSTAIRVIDTFSLALLFIYFQAFFYRFRFINIPFTTNRPFVTRAISVTISAILSMATIFLLNYAVDALMTANK